MDMDIIRANNAVNDGNIWTLKALVEKGKYPNYIRMEKNNTEYLEILKLLKSKGKLIGIKSYITGPLIYNDYEVLEFLSENKILPNTYEINESLFLHGNDGINIKTLNLLAKNGVLPSSTGADNVLSSRIQDIEKKINILNWLSERKIYPTNKYIKEIWINVDNIDLAIWLLNHKL